MFEAGLELVILGSLTDVGPSLPPAPGDPAEENNGDNRPNQSGDSARRASIHEDGRSGLGGGLYHKHSLPYLYLALSDALQLSIDSSHGDIVADRSGGKSCETSCSEKVSTILMS